MTERKRPYMVLCRWPGCRRKADSRISALCPMCSAIIQATVVGYSKAVFADASLRAQELLVATTTAINEVSG